MKTIKLIQPPQSRTVQVGKLPRTQDTVQSFTEDGIRIWGSSEPDGRGGTRYKSPMVIWDFDSIDISIVAQWQYLQGQFVNLPDDVTVDPSLELFMPVIFLNTINDPYPPLSNTSTFIAKLASIEEVDRVGPVMAARIRTHFETA